LGAYDLVAFVADEANFGDAPIGLDNFCGHNLCLLWFAGFGGGGFACGFGEFSRSWFCVVVFDEVLDVFGNGAVGFFSLLLDVSVEFVCYTNRSVTFTRQAVIASLFPYFTVLLNIKFYCYTIDTIFCFCSV
jgi:hypothetical protein